MKSQQQVEQQAEQIHITDYLEYFGLVADPFEPQALPFFDEDARGEQFSQLLHLSQFSDALLGITGQAGLGKNSFKAELIERLDPEDIVVEIKVPLLSDAFSLLSEAVEKFGLEHPAKQTAPNTSAAIFEFVHLLREFGSEKTEDDALKILILEDAHNLGSDALKAFASLCLHQLENHRSIHVVMFGEQELGDRLIALENEKLLVQVFELQPLTQEMLKHYLRFRLDAVGFEGIFPFKSEDIEFLWEISRGVPADAHEAARDILIELATPPPESKSVGLPIPHMALIVVLVAGLLAALFYQVGTSPESENEITSVIPKQLASTKNISNETYVIDNSRNQTAQFGDANVTENDFLIESDLEKNGEIINSNEYNGSSENKRTDRKASDKKAEKISPPTLSTEKIKADIRADLADTSTPLTPKKIVKASTKNATKPASEKAGSEKIAATQSVEQSLSVQANRSKLTADETALMKLGDDIVALQILAGTSLAAVETFANRQENKNDLLIYPALRNGKTYYIVLCGQFQSTALAREGISGLPREQQKAGPWPRVLLSVKDEIRKYRDF